MALEVLGAAEQAFLTVAGAVSGSETVEIKRNLNLEINSLDLRVIVANFFENAGVQFLWQLVELAKTKVEFDELKIKKVGPASKREIKALLKEFGLSFGMKFPASFVKRTE